MELKPFSGPAPMRVHASINTAAEWSISFKLDDPAGLVLDSLNTGQWASWDRADDLWKTTCLEAFWGVPGEPFYWELNLSPSRQLWNLYYFRKYREPQPPTWANDFKLADISVTKDTLNCVLIPQLTLPAVEVSLTAIIRTQEQTHYFATKHAGTNADFHLRASFASIAIRV